MPSTREFVLTVSRALEGLAHEVADPREMLERALARVREIKRDAWGDLASRPYSQQPSATAGVVVLGDSEVRWALVGDCSIAVLDRDGTVVVEQNAVLEALDAEVVRAMVAEAKRRPDAGNAEIREIVRPLLIEQRNLANSPEGFPVLTFDGVGVARAQCGSMPISRVSALAVASDGFARAIDLFGLAEWRQVLTGERGLAEIVSRMRELEGSDRRCVTYPRTKPHDDATAVLMRVVSPSDCEG